MSFNGWFPGRKLTVAPRELVGVLLDVPLGTRASEVAPVAVVTSSSIAHSSTELVARDLARFWRRWRRGPPCLAHTSNGDLRVKFMSDFVA